MQARKQNVGGISGAEVVVHCSLGSGAYQYSEKDGNHIYEKEVGDGCSNEAWRCSVTGNWSRSFVPPINREEKYWTSVPDPIVIPGEIKKHYQSVSANSGEKNSEVSVSAKSKPSKLRKLGGVLLFIFVLVPLAALYLAYHLADILGGVAIALATVAFTPFFEMAHLTKQLLDENRQSGVIAACGRTLFYIFVRIPAQVVLITFLSLFEAIYRGVKGGVLWIKGAKIRSSGGISGALRLPWNNINWSNKERIQPHMIFVFDSELASPSHLLKNEDSYYFHMRDVLVLALIIGLVMALTAVIIISSGAAVSAVTAVVNFLAVHTPLNLVALTVPQLSAVAFFLVAATGAAATLVAEAGLYVVTGVLNIAGLILSFMLDRLPKLPEWFEMESFTSGPETSFYRGLYDKLGMRRGEEESGEMMNVLLPAGQPQQSSRVSLSGNGDGLSVDTSAGEGAPTEGEALQQEFAGVGNSWGSSLDTGRGTSEGAPSYDNLQLPSQVDPTDFGSNLSDFALRTNGGGVNNFDSFDSGFGGLERASSRDMNANNGDDGGRNFNF